MTLDSSPRVPRAPAACPLQALQGGLRCHSVPDGHAAAPAAGLPHAGGPVPAAPEPHAGRPAVMTRHEACPLPVGHAVDRRAHLRWVRLEDGRVCIRTHAVLRRAGLDHLPVFTCPGSV